VERGVDEACAAFYEKKKQSPIFGDELFREQIRGYLSADSNYTEVPEKRYLNKVPSIETIMDVCARRYGVKPEVLVQDGRRGPGEIRTIAIGLCRLIGGHSLKEIGTAFGGLSYMGVSSAVLRFKKRREKDNDFNRWISEIEQRLKSR
jgi:chromosomal replication initiation ATPase DnaA